MERVLRLIEPFFFLWQSVVVVAGGGCCWWFSLDPVGVPLHLLAEGSVCTCMTKAPVTPLFSQPPHLISSHRTCRSPRAIIIIIICRSPRPSEAPSHGHPTVCPPSHAPPTLLHFGLSLPPAYWLSLSDSLSSSCVHVRLTPPALPW